MSSVPPIREGFNTLSPHITVDGAKAAIQFYEKAFGATLGWCHGMPGSDLIMNASLRIGNSSFMLNDVVPGGPPPPAEGGAPVTLNLYVEDADAVWAKAIEAGATVVYPIEDAFWGDRYGLLKDPFGHQWAIATHKEDVSEEELAARSASLFSQDQG